MTATVKKGDIVALAFCRSWTHLNGSTERRIEFTLAKVNTASRDGLANSLVRAGGTVLERRRKDFYSGEVKVISGANQEKALRAFSKLTWCTDTFDSQDDLKSFILSQ